ncbi:MAG: adenosylcobinamide amidohydrolase [Methanocalculaceae archaeon]|nr:adenosylcobinamide amidohydrolase [Methanocalculaceae archaeon]
MRYHYNKNTVYIRGKFRAASTGVDGGLRTISTILNRTVPIGFNHADPSGYIRKLLVQKVYGTDAFGLLTAVCMQHLCVLQYDYITVFVTAGVSNQNPDPARQHTINIIVTSDESLSDAATLETIMTTTEAKIHALRNLGRDFTGTTSDAVVVAAVPEDVPRHTCAGTLTETGRRVYDAVLTGVAAALDRHEGRISRTQPSYFIYSHYGENHWVEWQKNGCPYYPCHFKDQVCDFCYCPFYPCYDTELGEFATSSSGGKVWACTSCLLLHKLEATAYLKAHPDATLEELKQQRM